MTKYERLSFETVRKMERARLRELEAAGAELNAADHVRQAFSDGVEPADFRTLHEARAQRALVQHAALAANPLPEAERLTGPAATCAVLSNLGRCDLAERHADTNKIARPQRLEVRELIGRLLGARIGAGIDLTMLFQAGIEDASRAELSAVGTFPTSALGAAVRDASLMLIADTWMRSGAFWRAACRIVSVSNFRTTRVWAQRSGGVSVEPLTQTAPVPQAADGAGDWPVADVTVRERAERIALSRPRAVNSGFAELGAFVAAAVASWNDDLDRMAATALDGAPEWTGMIGDWPNGAAAALAGQTVGGLTLGSDMPCVLAAGDGDRRLLAYQVGAVPAAEGDRRASCDQAVYSSAVEAAGAARAYLIHSFRPLVLPVLGVDDLMPRLALGQSAGVRDDAGRPVQFGASVRADYGDPVLLKVGALGVGAVKLVIT